jgi:hypothetical protein
VAVVIAALGASALTILGTLGLDWVRARLEAKKDRNTALAGACERLISGALKLAHRSGLLYQAMIARSGFTESLDIVLHHRKPTDAMEVGEWLMNDLGPIIDAQATIWLYGTEKLIRSASEVVLASSDVIGKSTALADSQKPGELSTLPDYLREIIRRFKQLPRVPEMEAARNESIRQLGHRCREFGQVMRHQLKTSDPDALLRSFPEP